MNDSHLVLLAHGSKNPTWRMPFDALLEELRQGVGEDRVHLAYLQMTGPSLTTVVQGLASQGAKTIRILPLLMAAGTHAYEDIPSEVESLRELNPGVSVEILPPIGANPRFRSLMREIVKESL